MRNREPFWRAKVPQISDTCLVEHINYEHSVKLLKPTGKWKLRRDSNGEIDMEVQHKSWWFKFWISEEDIVYQCQEVILHCGDS